MMPPILPTGTVTFLFTDIEGSTPLWEREPERMRPALARHNAILRQAVAAHNGALFKTIGDAIQAAFALPADGLAAALAAQRELEVVEWPTSTPLRVRMGLHAGAAEPDGAEYAVAHSLNRVARIMAAAHGGQIVLSAEVAELLHGALPPDSSLRDLGQHRMKGMTQREHLFQLVALGLPAEFPPLTTLDAIPNNLPVQLNSFVGREREIAEVRALLTPSTSIESTTLPDRGRGGAAGLGVRLLTLTGPGGTGKTRLSLQIAVEVLPDFAHGAWLVELAPLADPAYLPQGLAAVFDVRESPGQLLLDVVIDYLRAKRVLLILDNCEHLIDACAQLADDLLRACPGLKILASSREALGVAGETAYRVPSLALPDSHADAATPATLARSEAARLFVERAQAAQARFTLTERNAPAVAALCRRLDGIPLALELAAARVRVLPVEQIVARLDDRFRLLVGGSRTALPRQQTLRALIDWSYDLLPEDERRLLRTLSVFAGGATLEAAEAVGADSDVLGLLTQLVNKSLVAAEEDGPTARYRLLETIRQYAREKLLDEKGGAAEAARDRHLAFFVQMSEAAEPRLMGADMIAALDELEADQDNLRAALEWALDPGRGDPLAALRLMGVLWWLWGRRTSLTEGRQLAQAALARAESAPSAAEPAFQAARARVLEGQSWMGLQLGDNPAALAAAIASMALARQVGASRTLASALAVGAAVSFFVGDVATAMGDLARAQAWVEESLALSRQHGYRYELSITTSINLILDLEANPAVPLELREECLRTARATGNPWAIAFAIRNVSRVARMAGELDAAYAGYAECAALYQQMRDRTFYNASRSEMGHVLRQQGRHAEAAAMYAQTLLVWPELGQRAAVAHELECLAFIAVEARQTERAAQLFGAAEALRELIGSFMIVTERHEYELAVAQLRAQAELATVAAAWARGRALTMDQAIAYALVEVQ